LPGGLLGRLFRCGAAAEAAEHASAAAEEGGHCVRYRVRVQVDGRAAAATLRYSELRRLHQEVCL
jgi:hypothetical protein